MSYDSFFKQAKEAQQTKKKSLSEEQIESELRRAFGMKSQVKQKSKKTSKAPAPVKTKNRQRKSFPIYPIFSALAMMAGLSSYLLEPEFFNDHLSRIEVGFMGEAAASGGQKAPPTKVESKENSAAVSGTDKNLGSEKPKAVVTEDPSYFSKLRERKEQLDAREAELNQLEEELQRQKAEIEQRIVELTQVRKEIATTLEERVQADEGKVKKLVDLYSSMKPKQAAEVITSIDSDLAVQVLASMKKKSAADIMNVLTAEKAKELSEKLTGYRRGTASER